MGHRGRSNPASQRRLPSEILLGNSARIDHVENAAGRGKLQALQPPLCIELVDLCRLERDNSRQKSEHD
jgi:hypothetical protein